jgi:hypothetical protein
MYPFTGLVTRRVTRLAGYSQGSVSKIMLSWTSDGEAHAIWGCTSYRPRNLCKIYSPFVPSMESRAFKQNIINKCNWKVICGSETCFGEDQFRSYCDRTTKHIHFTFYDPIQKSRKEVSWVYHFRISLEILYNSQQFTSCFPLLSSSHFVHTNVGCDNQVIYSP